MSSLPPSVSAHGFRTFGLASRERLGDARTAQARRSRAKTRSKGGTLRAAFIPDAHLEWDGPGEWTTRRPQRALRWPRSWPSSCELVSQEMFAGGAAPNAGQNAQLDGVDATLLAHARVAPNYVQVVEPALIDRAAAFLRYLETALNTPLSTAYGLASLPGLDFKTLAQAKVRLKNTSHLRGSPDAQKRTTSKRAVACFFAFPRAGTEEKHPLRA